MAVTLRGKTLGRLRSLGNRLRPLSASRRSARSQGAERVALASGGFCPQGPVVPTRPATVVPQRLTGPCQGTPFPAGALNGLRIRGALPPWHAGTPGDGHDHGRTPASDRAPPAGS